MTKKVRSAPAALTLLILTVAIAADANSHEQPAAAVVASKSDLEAGAENAVAAVDRFSLALAAGRFDAVAAELAPDVLILEGGGAEHSAQEYLQGHAKSDAAFLREAKTHLLRRVARVSGQFAWVGSEFELQVQQDGKASTFLSAETMLLQMREGAWKIVHIHWSSRKRAPAG